MQPIPIPAVPETPLAAASMVLLREAPTGLEVLLLRRNAKASNMPGLYVFPGGKLDAADQTLDAAARLDQPAATLQASLNEPDLDAPTAAGLYMAALRETLEECGLLLAEPAGAQASLDAPRARALLRAGQPFAEVLAALQLRLQTRQIAPWSRWITPRSPTVSTRRFDTRFFIAQAPAGQTARHDDEETTDSVWVGPRAALDQYQAGSIDLAPPQIMGLAHLSRHASVRSVLDEARRQHPPCILPEHFDRDGTRVLCYPGDENHSVTKRALPGPTRLLHVRGQFVPEDGFEALFT